MMRISGLLLAATLAAVPAAAQTPLSTIAPPPGPLLGPRTVVPATIACTDLPAPASPSPTLRIAAPHADDRHELAYRDDVVVLSAGTPQGVSAGQRFYARRFVPPVQGVTISAESPGSIRTTGWLTVIAADDYSALARVDYACTAIAAGDYLEPYEDASVPDTLAPRGPTDFSELGRVLFGTDRREAFGAGDLLLINRGASNGLMPGARIAFYRDRRNGTPLVELGAGIVLEVTADTAKVVVDRARFTINSGDYFGVQQP